jgi:hypothetical protein
MAKKQNLLVSLRLIIVLATLVFFNWVNYSMIDQIIRFKFQEENEKFKISKKYCIILS